MSIIWPNRVTVNPTLVQVLLRIVHWACAAASLYFAYRMIAYLVKASGDVHWDELGGLILATIGLWLGGRGLRFMLGGE